MKNSESVCNVCGMRPELIFSTRISIKNALPCKLGTLYLKQFTKNLLYYQVNVRKSHETCGLLLYYQENSRLFTTKRFESDVCTLFINLVSLEIRVSFGGKGRVWLAQLV